MMMTKVSACGIVAGREVALTIPPVIETGLDRRWIERRREFGCFQKVGQVVRPRSLKIAQSSQFYCRYST